MLTAALCQQIAQVVEHVRSTQARRVVVKAKRRVKENLEEYMLHTLESVLTTQFPGLDLLTLRVVSLMVYLGPREGTFPPLSLAEEVLGLVSGFAADRRIGQRPGWVVEIVVAYGCLWGRQATSGNPAWDTHWPGAVQEIVDITHNFIVQTIETLSQQVWAFQPSWQQLRGDAAMIAALFTERAQPALGAAKYKSYQTIKAWKPAESNLYGWLKRAIRGGGSQSGRLQPNWFRAGLLFPCLQSTGQLDIGKVAFQRCRENPLTHVSKYTDGFCCGKNAFIFQKTLFFVPGTVTGHPFRLVDHIFDWEKEPHCSCCKVPHPDKVGWQCRCKKQHLWVNGPVACPVCGDERPLLMEWRCQNHYHTVEIEECPCCERPASRRITTFWA